VCIQALDTDNKGYLTADELRELLTKNEEHFSSDEITEMLAYAVDAETGHCVYTGGVFIYYLSISLFILAH